MELVLAAGLDEVLVAADPSGLHSLGRQLLQFVRHLNAIMNKYIPKKFDKFFQIIKPTHLDSFGLKNILVFVTQTDFFLKYF